MKILKLLLGVSMLLLIAIACQREEVPIEKQETESDFITEVLFKGKGESGLDSTSLLVYHKADRGKIDLRSSNYAFVTMGWFATNYSGSWRMIVDKWKSGSQWTQDFSSVGNVTVTLVGSFARGQFDVENTGLSGWMDGTCLVEVKTDQDPNGCNGLIFNETDEWVYWIPSNGIISTCYRR